MANKFLNIQDWLRRHEWHVSSAAILFGFIFDALTLRRIDFFWENFFLVAHLITAAIAIVLLNISIWQRWMPIFIQWSFGGLISCFLIFYFRSASLAASWPFFLFLGAVFAGNEIFKRQYIRLSFQIWVLFICLFLYDIFNVPTVLGQMGDQVFLLSGAITLLFTGLLLAVLRFLAPGKIKRTRRYIWSGVGGTFILMNIFYFTNVLPPIPLALKDAGIYHSLTKVPEGYLAQEEVMSWWQRFSVYPEYHFRPGDLAYSFSAVFAPTELKTSVVHRWQHYNEETKKWETISKVSFPVLGGRDGGYRGYSMGQISLPGWWRVDVETPRGQLIGRTRFRAAISNILVSSQSETL